MSNFISSASDRKRNKIKQLYNTTQRKASMTVAVSGVTTLWRYGNVCIARSLDEGQEVLCFNRELSLPSLLQLALRQKYTSGWIVGVV